MKTINNVIAVAVFAVVIFLTITTQNVFAQQNDLKFDQKLQADFSVGMGGDAAALTRAFERSEKILEANPQDAETLVWHGSATVASSGKAFQNKNYAEGWAMWKKGLAEMDKAVELAPESFVVRIVRGATFLNASKRYPDPNVATELREKGVADYEKILSFTDEKSAKMAASQKPKILNGLIEAYDKAGDKTKADFYREQLAKTAK
ncbi:MAG: hypothetical protein H7Z37_02095 [Pyrinomonadaceae bacterium]|nr:hypothetical protein [Pyrinomonadaceae bacterium]